MTYNMANKNPVNTIKNLKDGFRSYQCEFWFTKMYIGDNIEHTKLLWQISS